MKISPGAWGDRNEIHPPAPIKSRIVKWWRRIKAKKLTNIK